MNLQPEPADETRPNFSAILRVLSATIARAEQDAGATYDRMAENIRRNAADGIIEEAIGYVPIGTETLSIADPFKPTRCKTKAHRMNGGANYRGQN